MNAHARSQVAETTSDVARVQQITTKPTVASRLGLALFIASGPLTLAWFALLGWLCVDLVRGLL